MEQDEYLRAYWEIMKGFLDTDEEIFLLQAFDLGKQMLNDGLSTEFAADMHFRTLEKVGNGLRVIEEEERRKAELPFLELTIAFGMAFRDQLGALLRFMERIEIARREWETSFDSITDPIAIIDFKGCINRANKAFYTLVGKEKAFQDVIGQPCWRLFYDTGKPPEGCQLPGCAPLSLHLPASYELYIPKLSRYFTTSFHPVHDNTGVSSYLVYTMKDITERKRMEAALRRFSEELELKVEERTKELKNERDYTRHLRDSSPDFQLTVNKEGLIIGVNAAFEHIVGTSRENIFGEHICKYFPEKECNELIGEIYEKEKVRNTELTANIPGKGNLILNVSGTIFTTTEGEKWLYLTGRDLTELRAKEMQLIHAGRLSSLGEMAAGVAHEINQPLSLISMAAEGTLRDIEKNHLDISTLPQDLEDIMKNVRRIDRIITHMRTFAREPEEIRVVNSEEVLNHAFILLGELFKRHDISVSCEIEDKLPAIKVDANQLEQVFVNILTNARQVLDERGEEAKKEGTSFEKRLVCGISRERIEEKDYVVCEFADNAYGVQDELKTKVFEPFFTTKEPGEGTGLGLSIAYGIVVRALGGKIWVEDNDKGGASFKVALPVSV